jgi:hypothetical protein
MAKAIGGATAVCWVSMMMMMSKQQAASSKQYHTVADWLHWLR